MYFAFRISLLCNQCGKPGPRFPFAELLSLDLPRVRRSSDMWPLAALLEGADKVSDKITSQTTRLGLFLTRVALAKMKAG